MVISLCKRSGYVMSLGKNDMPWKGEWLPDGVVPVLSDWLFLQEEWRAAWHV